jgi:hypothetical protein
MANLPLFLFAAIWNACTPFPPIPSYQIKAMEDIRRKNLGNMLPPYLTVSVKP